MECQPQDYKNFESARKQIARLEKAFQKGDGKAGYNLATIYSPSCCFVPEEVQQKIGASEERSLEYMTKSFGLLKREAKRGDAESMHLVALYYQCGTPPVSEDRDLCLEWNEKAFAAGCVIAADDLLAYYGNPKSVYYDEQKASGLRRFLGI
jgi:TPR repeat protein